MSEITINDIPERITIDPSRFEEAWSWLDEHNAFQGKSAVDVDKTYETLLEISLRKGVSAIMLSLVGLSLSDNEKMIFKLTFAS